jgi:anti-sigma factor RsiW
MRCRSALRRASRAIDGDLPPDEAAALDRHLASCAACRAAVDRLRGSWRALGRLADVAPPPDDWARIEAALDRPRRWVPAWLDLPAAFRPAAAWAIAVMIALGATGGTLASRAAFAPRPAHPLEVDAVAETLGDLPWRSPASALAGPLVAAQPDRERRTR